MFVRFPLSSLTKKKTIYPEYRRTKQCDDAEDKEIRRNKNEEEEEVILIPRDDH